jgi:hypothetical protein
MSIQTISKVNSRTTVTSRDKQEFRAYTELEAVHANYDNRKSLNKKARLFWQDEFKTDNGDADVLGQRPEYGARGVDAELDAAWDAYNKHHVKLVKQAIIATLGRVVPDIKPNEVSYSRKAGCSCPCSPGFIISDRIRDVFGAKSGNGDVAEFRLDIRYYS